MSSQKNVQIVEDKCLENVIGADSMINQQTEIHEELKENKGYDENKSVIHSVGSTARSLTSKFPPITGEVVMFLYMFSYIMRSITSTTMIMEKVCRVHLNYSKETCEHLKDYPGIKSEVEKMANNYQLGQSLVQLIPSAILAIFIGSWSDKYGRRFPIICAQIGIIIDGLGSTICAYYISSRVEYYFIPAIFTGFSGGYIGVLLTLYSYASDITTSGKRTVKYAYMELAIGISNPLGSLAGGWIYKYYNYVPVFLTSTFGHILALGCVSFFLDETRGLDNKDPLCKKFRTFWSLDALITSLKTTVKKRPNRGREQIWLLILAMSVGIFSFSSLGSVTFFYVHHMYDWGNTTYSTITAIYSVIGLFFMTVVLLLSKKYKFGDAVLGIIGSVSLLLKIVVTGLAFKAWIYHLANLAGLLINLSTLAGRSRMSKIVPKDDLGKIFALLTTAEFIFPIISSTIVSQAFNATLDFFPGLIFVVMGVIIIIPVCVYIWMSRLPVINFEEMEEGQPQEETKADEVEN